jgi:hypothetical protein
VTALYLHNWAALERAGHLKQAAESHRPVTTPGNNRDSLVARIALSLVGSLRSSYRPPPGLPRSRATEDFPFTGYRLCQTSIVDAAYYCSYTLGSSVPM